MRKPHIVIISEVFKEWHRDLVEDGFKLLELFDKIIAWLIGLSTGAIVLIFSSLDKLIIVVTRHALDVTLSFLVASIILGIIGRVLHAIATYLGYFLSSLFAFQLKLLQLPHNPRELEGDETAEDIYHFMQEDFKIDMPSIIDYKKSVSEEKWIVIDETARKFYTDYAKGSSDSINESMKVINAITTKTFGYKDDYFEKKKNTISRTKGLICRWFTNIAYVLYILCAIFFGVSVLYFFLQYVC